LGELRFCPRDRPAGAIQIVSFAGDWLLCKHPSLISRGFMVGVSWLLHVCPVGEVVGDRIDDCLCDVSSPADMVGVDVGRSGAPVLRETTVSADGIGVGHARQDGEGVWER